METTRHFVATCYVVCDGATLLHEHDELDMWLPPGGHVDRDELPHETALRETYEETGLRPELVTEAGPYDTDQVTSLPRPAAFLLEDIDVRRDGRVAHQHLDFVYFGAVGGREVVPGAATRPIPTPGRGSPRPTSRPGPASWRPTSGTSGNGRSRRWGECVASGPRSGL